MDIKESEIGHTFSSAELKENFRMIYGAVSFSRKNPGFAVVVGMGQKRHLDSYDLFLLDEYESSDLPELIRQCGALNFRYRPNLWIGDWKNDAAGNFIDELNEDNRRKRECDSTIPRRQFELSYTWMLEMKHLYPYIVGQIRELTHKDRKRLWLKEGKVVSYLLSIEESEIASFEIGEYPAVEALAFAIRELRDAIEQENKMPEKPYKYDYDPLDARDL